MSSDITITLNDDEAFATGFEKNAPRISSNRFRQPTSSSVRRPRLSGAMPMSMVAPLPTVRRYIFIRNSPERE